MTKFIYLADTHFGADPMGYQQQKGYVERLPELLDLLDAWIQEEGGGDFVLHGGDLVDKATDCNIRGAGELFRLSVPVYVCLGNHDLTDANALGVWLPEAPALLAGGDPNYTITCDGCVVHVVPNQWCSTPYLWDAEQTPQFLDTQLEELEADLAQEPGAIHILATHSPTLGVPCDQTGLEQPYHRPSEDFARVVLRMAEKHPQLRVVLGAHNHLNMHLERDGAHFVTASSFTEVPFEFKVFEVDPPQIRMSTISLTGRTSFRAEYDYDKTFVQGRLKDRSFEDPGSES